MSSTQTQPETHNHVHSDSCGHGCSHNYTYVRSGPKIGRNDPCPCQSGKKHKKCCGKS